MKLRGIIALAFCWPLAGVAPAFASETGPVIVIPGRPGVPIIVNGQDISGAVIEGDWGLARPGQIEPRILYRYGNGALIGPARQLFSSHGPRAAHRPQGSRCAASAAAGREFFPLVRRAVRSDAGDAATINAAVAACHRRAQYSAWPPSVDFDEDFLRGAKVCRAGVSGEVKCVLVWLS